MYVTRIQAVYLNSSIKRMSHTWQNVFFHRGIIELQQQAIMNTVKQMPCYTWEKDVTLIPGTILCFEETKVTGLLSVFVEYFLKHSEFSSHDSILRPCFNSWTQLSLAIL